MCVPLFVAYWYQYCNIRNYYNYSNIRVNLGICNNNFLCFLLSFLFSILTYVQFLGDLNDVQRSVSPTRSILKRSSSFENQNQLTRRPEFDAPVRDSGRSNTPTGRLAPGGRQPKGMIVAGGRSSSPG